MKPDNIEISNIFGGISPNLFGQEGSYLGACAIDPDEEVSSRISGTISPVSYGVLTTAVSDVLWFEPNDKNDDIYYYTSDGKFGKIDASGSATEVSALASASGNGLRYYNNYYYIARDEDVIRYGPINATASFETQMTDDNVTLSLSNRTLDAVGDYNIPNHDIFLHSNNSMYIVDTASERRGMIHKLNVYDFLETASVADFVLGETATGGTSGATGTIMTIVDDTETGLCLINVDGTFQSGEAITGTTGGSTTASSAIQEGYYPVVLRDDLAIRDGFYPVCIDAYGTDLVIGAVSSENAELFFWDGDADSFYMEVELPYSTLTSVVNFNGDLYTIGGDSESFSLGQYAGGETVREIYKCDHGIPPLLGAIRTSYNRILFGSKQTYPETRGCVWAWDTRYRSLHSVRTNPSQISAITREMTSCSDGTYEKATTGYDSIWRSQMINFSQPFTINKITIPFSGTFGTGGAETTVKVKIYYDNERTSDEHTITLEDDSRTFTVYPETMGTTNFFLEITIEGDTFVSVNLPIRVEYQIEE